MAHREFLSGGSGRGAAVLAVKAGDVLFIRHFVSPTFVPLAEIERRDDGSKLLKFSKPAIIIVQDLHENMLTARNLLLARDDRRSEIELVWREPRVWPKLNVALRFVDVKPVRFPADIRLLPIFSDEMAFRSEGGIDELWILDRDTIPDLLEALPPKKCKAIASKSRAA